MMFHNKTVTTIMNSLCMLTKCNDGLVFTIACSLASLNSVCDVSLLVGMEPLDGRVHYSISTRIPDRARQAYHLYFLFSIKD